MECFKIVLLGLMELVELRNVQYLPEIHSSMSSQQLTKLVPSGIIPIVVRVPLCYSFIQSLILIPSATQYCDGLRGPLVIYDSDDPYLSEYVHRS